MEVILEKFQYKYLAYESELLKSELQALVPHATVENKKHQMVLHNIKHCDLDLLKKLTYIASYTIQGNCNPTDQFLLEYSSEKKIKRQNTRYASHGIHEYKGKFNPQIVHSLINILGLTTKDIILDPFCGSGTTLIESSIRGIDSLGIDINPLAVQLSLLKTQVLHLDCNEATSLLSQVIIALELNSNVELKEKHTPRIQYLLKWIPEDTLCILEKLLQFVSNDNPTIALLFKLTASNLIREYSLQEPLDLRIRKRISPLPTKPFLNAWSETVARQIESIKRFQNGAPSKHIKSEAVLGDIRNIQITGKVFDAAITSPPYATALPYIDTQRISLVWLGLCNPDEIMNLERSLIGSREFYNAQKENLQQKIEINEDDLPMSVIGLVRKLFKELTVHDGFRKKAVPLLLYRYFADMKLMFSNVYKFMKPNAKYALVIGSNKTTIGGNSHIIDTPKFLAEIAMCCNWIIKDMFPLQTYQRYGLNAKNGINNEVLVILEKN